VNSEKTKCMLMLCKKAGQKHGIEISNRSGKIQIFGSNTNRSKLYS
jgi:hypothetical protein